jgi:hypothetical protein
MTGLFGRRNGDPDILKKMATHNLAHATRGIFRAIFKLGSPEFMMKRSLGATRTPNTTIAGRDSARSQRVGVRETLTTRRSATK